MKSRSIFLAAAALILAPMQAAAGAHVESGSSLASTLALPSAALDVVESGPVMARLTWTEVSDDDGSVRVQTTNKQTTRKAVRYRPRKSSYRGQKRDYTETHGFTQIHGGAFDPEGGLSSAFVFGLRAGSQIENRIQLGLGIDWSRRTDARRQLIATEDLPGGNVAERRLELARSTTDLLPISGFLQLAPLGDIWITPYVGVSGGYQVLFVSADDFETGESFNATFGGWGWQAWAGAALPLTSSTSLTGEVFANNAELARDVADENGGKVREVVNVDGVGFRAGLNWGF